jgi:cyclopropane fatty-acyl-phospholipid synthase-like methyltransferase
MKFVEGSFTEIPSEVASEKYSVVFSQVAFCHVAKLLPTILEQVKGVLAPGGVLIVNDYLGGDNEVSDTTKEHVWKRLHFEHLHGHRAWRNIVEESGFVIQCYENLDKHMAQTYRDMAKKAEKLDLKSTDGTPLAVNYSESVHAIEVGEVGMNLARLSLLGDGGLQEEVKPIIEAQSSAAENGIVKNVEIGEEKNQKDYYDKASHYDLVWGLDNIHLGYYPHLVRHNEAVLDNVEAADALTQKMIDVAQIDKNSTVLDLGCGKGQACRFIAERTGATVTGVDLGSTNIQRANEVATSRSDLRMKFFEGSFTDIPSEVASQKYSVVFSQVAFCHVAKLLPSILEQVKRVLAPGGVLIVNDYLGGDHGVSQKTKDHVWKRLHFEHLHGHRAWRKITEDSGFVIQYYENLDRHMAQTYRDMARKAEKLSLKSTDGTPLAVNYTESVHAIEGGEVGMNLARLSL